MTKTYQLTRLYTLVMPVSTLRGLFIVEFKGVQNMKMRGTFTTSVPTLQEALEGTEEYKRKVFRLVSTVGEQQKDTSATADKSAGKTAKKTTAEGKLFE